MKKKKKKEQTPPIPLIRSLPFPALSLPNPAAALSGNSRAPKKKNVFKKKFARMGIPRLGMKKKKFLRRRIFFSNKNKGE